VLAYIYPEATLPLGALPTAVRDVAWGEVYEKMALWGLVLGAAGAAVGYFAAPKKKRRRYAVYGGVGCATITAGAQLLVGWRRIRAAESVWDYMESQTSQTAPS